MTNQEIEEIVFCIDCKRCGVHSSNSAMGDDFPTVCRECGAYGDDLARCLVLKPSGEKFVPSSTVKKLEEELREAESEKHKAIEAAGDIGVRLRAAEERASELEAAVRAADKRIGTAERDQEWGDDFEAEVSLARADLVAALSTLEEQS